MKRRRFLKVLGLGLVSIAVVSLRQWNKGEDLKTVYTFFVAGVRFNLQPDGVVAGDRVVIKKEAWRGEKSLGVYTEKGERIGYVPRTLISSIDNLADHNWQLESVDRHTVPWKQYKIIQC